MKVGKVISNSMIISEQKRQNKDKENKEQEQKNKKKETKEKNAEQSINPDLGGNFDVSI